jgi:hypothetical protein
LSLNVKTIGGKIDNLEPGSYPARLVQVVDLGMQPQQFKGEQKKPLREIYLTYELSDEFMSDEDGQPIKEKPRWLSENFPLYNIKSEKAKSTERYKSLDPSGSADGDFTQLLGNALMVTVINNINNTTKRVYDNVAGTQAMRTKDIEKLPPLVNKPSLFLLDEPDMEVYVKLPEFIKKKIMTNLEFAGSVLEAKLKETSDHTPPKQEAKAPVNDEGDKPF